jgi:hypothetical protein
MLSYILPLCIFYDEEVSVEKVFYIYVVFFLLTLPSYEFRSISLVQSTAIAEGSTSFVFGAFALFFMFNNKKFFSIVASVFLIITMKRIAVLGVLACIILFVLPKFLKKYLSSPLSLVFFNSTVVILLIALTLGPLALVFNVMTDKGANELTLGRTSHYFGVVEDMRSGYSWAVRGAGAGAGYEKAEEYYVGSLDKPNLHSDTLKILYEGGVFAFILFFYFLGKNDSTQVSALLLYMSILFATDNILIYSGTMFFLLFLIVKADSLSQKATIVCTEVT